ncbi:response regulator [Pseudoxanthomonas putridarboris]|uniref:Response regulator n=1 Tax=Pseudoxanthomonas putridarboris TaxID=752605 RepID=A0ABU9J3A4_9GAMM
MNIPSSPPKILIVDDDIAMLSVLVAHLKGQGMQISTAADSRGLEESLRAHQPDMVVLDLQLKQEDGLDLLREIRRQSDIPVIIITGHRRDEIDRVVGLELGADDYLPKPFGLHEFTARIRAVLRRRASRTPTAQQHAQAGGYRFGDWRLDVQSRALSNPAGEQVALTKSEYALLLAFLESPKRPLSRDQLLQATRVHDDVFDRSIDVQILRLRRKLEADPSSPEIIVTQRGVGYVFTLAVELL